MTMITQKEINEAVKVWLDYKDSDRYNDENAKKLCWARITIREALRQGCVIINPHEFNYNSATCCFTAIRNAMEER